MLNRALWVAFTAAVVGCASALAQSVTLVDVIPSSRSSETDQNSEPSIAVNPLNPTEILIGSFNNANPNPYFLSTTAGSIWSLFTSVAHSDETLEWSPGGIAYVARAISSSNGMDVMRSTNVIGGTTFTSIAGSAYTPSADAADQPWLEISRVNNVDHIYVGFNDLGQTSGKTASVRYSTDAGSHWNNVILENTVPAGGQDAPCVRVAANGNTVYAAYERYTGSITNSTDAIGSIIVKRDDTGGSSAFASLAGSSGVTVASGKRLPFSDSTSNGTLLGEEGLGSDLSIAVDPSNANRVYLSWADVQSGHALLHVSLSTNGGLTWQEKYQTLLDSALPALAITSKGVVGLLYTSLVGGNLESHLLETTDDFASTINLTLSRFTNGSPASGFDPYIGDYQDLEALGDTFYGTFSASNNTSLFPQQPLFNRDASLLGSSVAYSIDPYYFSTVVVPEPTSLFLLGLSGLALLSCQARLRSKKL